MRKQTHCLDFCVVGGGMAGLLAAVAAARHGVRTALVHDRPVLGGNASSEVRMHICGAHGENRRESGLLEEVQLENHYRNPLTNYSIWDSVLYGFGRYQENLELFLNCSVCDCATADQRIESVTGWQLTTETTHTICAKLFADCSGDGILAPLSGADFRRGREARSEFGETFGPDEADDKTMGLSCLLQAREYNTPQPFVPPDWAYTFRTPEQINQRNVDLRKTNFWWIEVGGEHDEIHDTEKLRDELLRIAFGTWDHLKNYSDLAETYRNWAIDWVGFLPGKRESRRYVGDHILTQPDIESAGAFDDIVAYGGWTMDDHFTKGFYEKHGGTIHHPAPSPFGIPYRTLYSRTIDNLFCAGRNHSATHAAMSATRVMATTSLMGQAVGTAAALAVSLSLTPRGVGEKAITELQNQLMEDDCFLPGKLRPMPELTASATLTASEGNPEPVRNGMDRSFDGVDNGWTGSLGGWLEYRFEESLPVETVRLVFDSDLNRVDVNRGFIAKNMRHYYSLEADRWTVPATMVRRFRVEAETSPGQWECVAEIEKNYQRLVRVPVKRNAAAVRVVFDETWGAETVHVFGIDVR